MWHARMEHLEYNGFKFCPAKYLLRVFKIRELCGHVAGTAIGSDGCWLGTPGMIG